MARKQTRRSVSMNRHNYEAVQQEARVRGMSISGLVEFALRFIGVPVVVHPQQSPELVRAVAACRGKRSRPIRCSVSINRCNYEAAKQEAASRGITIAGLVKLALGTLGVPVTVHHAEQLPELTRNSGVESSMAIQDGGRTLVVEEELGL